MISAIDMWPVSMVCHTAGIIKWRTDELEAMERRNRKLMAIYRLPTYTQELVCIVCTSRERNDVED